MEKTKPWAITNLKLRLKKFKSLMYLSLRQWGLVNQTYIWTKKWLMIQWQQILRTLVMHLWVIKRKKDTNFSLVKVKLNLRKLKTKKYLLRRKVIRTLESTSIITDSLFINHQIRWIKLAELRRVKSQKQWLLIPGIPKLKAKFLRLISSTKSRNLKMNLTKSN